MFAEDFLFLAQTGPTPGKDLALSLEESTYRSQALWPEDEETRSANDREALRKEAVYLRPKLGKLSSRIQVYGTIG